ncbi:MAG: diguanylate cyclase [Oceanospirillaceae bacterium]
MPTESLVKQEHLLQAVINAVPAPIFYKDSQGCYLGCNDAFEEFTGLSKSQLIGKTVFDLLDLELATIYAAADKALLEDTSPQIYEAQVKYADGSLHDVIFHKAIFNAKLAGIDGLVGVMLDVTDRNNIKRELENLAVTDSLTGLNNRYYMVNELEQAFSRANRTHTEIAFLMLDLDNFKIVNDTHGHPVGDALIIEVAARLKSVVRKNDTLARIGGDEFAIILEGLHSHDMAKNVAAKIIKIISHPFNIQGHNLSISMSAGIATTTDGSLNASDLMKKSDTAMYQVKAQKKGCYKFYDH